MKTNEAESLLTELERDPDRVQLHHAELEHLIASCTDEINEQSRTGEDDKRKVKLVAVEYQARLLLERFRKMGAN